MSTNTPNLNLFKWDTSNSTDLASTFDIDQSLNENWDKIDTAVKSNQTAIENNTDLINDTKEELEAEIEHLKAQIPTNTGSGEVVNITDATDMAMKKFEFDGKSEQKVGYIYQCDGTETGNYYYTYSSVSYQFTMPTVTSSDYILFDQNDKTFYKNGTTAITTTQASTGTELTMVVAPNPDYSQTIKTITGNTKIVCGKNCAEINTSEWILTANNTIKNKGRNAGASLFKTIYIKKGQSVKLYFKLISKPTQSTTFTTYLNDADDSSKSFENFYTYNLNQIYTKTFTVTKDARLYVKLWGNANSEIFEFQYWVTIDDTLADYEPYKGVTIALGSTELCKVGNVIDKLSINTRTGVVTKTSNIKKITLNGTETWSRENTTNAGYRFYTRIMENPTILNNGVVNCMANNLRGKTANNTWAGQDGISATSSYIQIYLTNYKAETVVNFKTWLSNNNVTAYYKLATPVEEVIGTLSQEQLETLIPNIGDNTYQILSVVGRTNINLEYYQNLPILINNLTALVSST